MPVDGYALGVDFGTSNTVAVVRWPDGRARPLLIDGSPLLPSAVFAEAPYPPAADGSVDATQPPPAAEPAPGAGPRPPPDGPAAAPGGSLVVGRDAVHSARLDPARFEPNPKRRIDDGTVLLGDRELPVVDLVAAVFGRVAEEWRRTVGMVRPDVTLTCPAVWGATRRQVLAEAAGAAGFGQVRLVAEPVAAATYFAQVLGRDVPIGSVVVVHDFGAGTFDASVVARTSSGFEVLAVDGRDDIGGLDVDAAVITHLAKTYAERSPQAWARLSEPETVAERRAKRQLWDDVRVAKERLSRSPTADLLVPLAEVQVHLTRPELERLAEPILAQTVRLTQDLMRWADLAKGRVAGVFLVGGSSRIPLLATLLHRALGEAPVALEQPELVVAEGSIMAEALAVPVQAPAAPGPTTGLLPQIPAAAYGAAGPPSLHPGEIMAVPASLPATPSADAVPISPAARSSAVALTNGSAPGSPAASGSPAGSAAQVSPAGRQTASRSVGRVVVPGAQPPGQAPRIPGANVAAVARTLSFPPAAPPVPASPAPQYRPAGSPRPASRPPGPNPPRAATAPVRPPRRRGRLRRTVLALLIALLLIAVPIVAGVVAYSIARGQGLLPDRLPSRLGSYHIG